MFLSVMPTYVNDGQVFRLTVQINIYKDDGIASRQLYARGEQLSPYVEAGS